MSFGKFLQKNFPDPASRFFASPPGQRLVAQAVRDHETEIHVQRAALAQQVAEHERQLAAALPDLQKAVDDANAAYVKARAVVNSAAARLRKAKAKRFDAQVTAENQIAALKAQLRRTAPEAIENLRLELLQEHKALRHQGLTFTEEHIGWKGGRPVYRHRSNRAAVHRRLAGLLEACRQLEALKETAVDDLPSTLKAIRDSIPSADVLEEYIPLQESTAWAASA